MKLSGIYGKRVGGAKSGYVVSVGADGDGLVLACADDDEREFFVSFSGAEFGEDCVLADGEREKGQFAPIRLGTPAFDGNGMYLGNLEDVTILKGRPKTAKIGKKNYPWGGLTSGDVLIVRNAPKLNHDVIKDGKVVFKKGTAITRQVLDSAAAEGVYVQTRLKCLPRE